MSSEGIYGIHISGDSSEFIEYVISGDATDGDPFRAEKQTVAQDPILLLADRTYWFSDSGTIYVWKSTDSFF